MNWNDGISGVHLEIASSTSPRIGVLAGPGTGKTSYGLIRRVARLLSEGVPGKKILLLSFTRTAAADLKAKVAELNAPDADQVNASTLHSYCFSILRKQSVLSLTRRKPRTLFGHETDLMLRDLQDSFGNIEARRNLCEAFEAGWARGTADHPGLATLPDDKRFERAVLGWLQHHDAMLIGEAVPIANDYLVNNPASEERGEYTHIIVDEYQDLNYLEQYLLDLLASSPGVNLCVAGDDDQSIYAFRYANPRGIIEYQSRAGVEKYSINVCGRCPQDILKMANALIANASGRNKPELTSNHTEQGNISITQWDDLSSEIDGVVSAIITDVIKKKRREAGDILVLAHRSRIGIEIRKKLKAQGVEACSYFGEEIFSTREARDAFALLQLACRDDKPALRVLLGSGDATGRSAAYVKLLNYSMTKNLSESEVLSNIAGGSRTSDLAIPALVKRYVALQAQVSRIKTLVPQEVVDELFPAGIENLLELRDLALSFLPISTTTNELLKNIESSITQVDVPQSPDFVRIMSLHKSKGLTSPAVFIVGFLEGIIPTIKDSQTATEQAAAIEEQRRLLYVALTRSSDQLVISSCISINLPDALGMGIKVNRDSIRNSGGVLVAKTIASTYAKELGMNQPRAVKGLDWISSY